jgi:hypothetical protein
VTKAAGMEPDRRPPGDGRSDIRVCTDAWPIVDAGIVDSVSPDALPPDPFAGDPHDPALSLDGEESDQERLSEVERDEVIADLADLAVYQALLETRGVRGIVVDCGDCGEQHFHEWSLLRASLQQLLDEGQMRPHEPAFDPDPASYVTWEYCRGYADAVLSDS